ncbi:MFS transporter [Flagellimonas myxillae]|uniref:MFS transporter n=1 Tax=Flagellimonas myxillae TaxID=2942214 RepID=UPI00201FAE1A|nr:MFS transporter [Muricauda myxillae]MCL6265893.1 MFS transporter [Muricauda myxillae]
MSIAKRTLGTKNQTLYNSKFILVCLGSLFFSASYNMLIPELPSYLSGLGGAEYIGLIIALFTLTAGLSRPFSGKLTDTIGRKPVMLIGALVCVVCGGLYPVLTSVYGFLLLRLFHGFSTGFTPTAASTFVSDVVPANRLGEAMGIQGIAFSTGLALGPALGSMIKLHFSFEVLFYSSSLMALLATGLLMNLKETLMAKQTFRPQLLRISKADILAKEAFPAAIITFLAYVAFGVILTLIPDWTGIVGFANKGIFFVVFTLTSLLVRVVAGKLSDLYGRTKVILIGLLLLCAGLIMIGAWNVPTGFLAGAGVYGLGMGIVSPGINAWTIDLSKPGQKGKAIATMFIALEAGIGLGALLSGWYYQEMPNRIPITLYVSAGLSFLGILYLLFRAKRKTTKLNSQLPLI